MHINVKYHVHWGPLVSALLVSSKLQHLVWLDCHCRKWAIGTSPLTRPIIAIFILFQFIVVSLKDGMFNNANVLFRTKFVDGMSTVSRTVNKVK